MTTTTLADSHPDDMPVWARLALARTGTAFKAVTAWSKTTSHTGYAFTTTHAISLSRSTQ